MKRKQAVVLGVFRPDRFKNPLYALGVASCLYSMMHGWGLVRRFSSALTGRSSRLLDLADVRRACDVRGRRSDGIRAVPLREIRGSGGRCGDFDVDFCPLRSHTKGRWVGIAVAQRNGRAMPPVELIQIGDVYFVRDGHHRISVARALNRMYLDAVVTVWAVEAGGADAA